MINSMRRNGMPFQLNSAMAFFRVDHTPHAKGMQTYSQNISSRKRLPDLVGSVFAIMFIQWVQRE